MHKTNIEEGTQKPGKKSQCWPCCKMQSDTGEKNTKKKTIDRVVRRRQFYWGQRRVDDGFKGIAKRCMSTRRRQKMSKRKRSNKYRQDGNRQFTEDGRIVEITVDMVLQARAKMSENKVNGPEDVVVSEMIKQLLQEKIYEVPRCFQHRSMGQMDAPNSWKIVKLVFLRKLDAAPKKSINSYRAIALTSVMSKWYATCLIQLLEKEKEPEAWKDLHLGGIDGISCQHFQVMMAQLLQKHWKWKT